MFVPPATSTNSGFSVGSGEKMVTLSDQVASSLRTTLMYPLEGQFPKATFVKVSTEERMQWHGAVREGNRDFLQAKLINMVDSCRRAGYKQLYLINAPEGRLLIKLKEAGRGVSLRYLDKGNPYSGKGYRVAGAVIDAPMVATVIGVLHGERSKSKLGDGDADSGAGSPGTLPPWGGGDTAVVDLTLDDETESHGVTQPQVLDLDCALLPPDLR